MGTKPDFVSSSSVLIMIDKTFLMDAVKTLECKGRFDFFDRNLFTFVKVDFKFSIITTGLQATSNDVETIYTWNTHHCDDKL